MLTRPFTASFRGKRCRRGGLALLASALLGCLFVSSPAAGALPAALAAEPGATASALATASPAAGASSAVPDRLGLRRDSAFLLSYQVGTVAFLYMLPEAVTNWTEEQKSAYGVAEWWENVRNPQWDSDDFYLNYVLHPYWGAAYYVRARERGYDETGAFWYSVAMSSAFEFGVEALFEEPSLQDIVVTPVAGVILGEYFMAVRERTLARYGPGQPMAFRDRAALALTDPIGALNRMVGSWLGIEEGNALLRPYLSHGAAPLQARFDGDARRDDTVYGLRFYYRW